MSVLDFYASVSIFISPFEFRLRILETMNKNIPLFYFMCTRIFYICPVDIFCVPESIYFCSYNLFPGGLYWSLYLPYLSSIKIKVYNSSYVLLVYTSTFSYAVLIMAVCIDGRTSLVAYINNLSHIDSCLVARSQEPNAISVTLLFFAPLMFLFLPRNILFLLLLFLDILLSCVVLTNSAFHVRSLARPPATKHSVLLRDVWRPGPICFTRLQFLSI